MVLVYLLMALVGAAAAVFALQNVDPVVIRFLGWRIEGAPLAMVIMLSVLAGIVLTSLVGLVQHGSQAGNVLPVVPLPLLGRLELLP